MKYCATLLFLLFVAGHFGQIRPGSTLFEPFAGKPTSDKNYRISYLPNLVLHDVYFRPEGTKKSTQAFSTDHGWSWHFTTVFGDGNDKENKVKILENKYKDKSSKEYIEARRDLENEIMQILRDNIYEPTGETLSTEMDAIFRPYKVFLSKQTILGEWEKQHNLEDIRKALEIEPNEDEKLLRNEAQKIIGDTLSAKDYHMTLEHSIEDVQTKLNIEADVAPIAKELRQRSIAGQLYHEYEKAGGTPIRDFYTELVSMSRSLGGIDLTKGKELEIENHQVKLKDLIEAINSHFREAAESKPEAGSKWGDLLKEFYSAHEGAMPFKLKVRQILPSLLSLEEVELAFDPVSNKLVLPKSEKPGKPGGKPQPDDDIKEVLPNTENVGRFEIAFIAAEPDLHSLSDFYTKNIDKLEFQKKKKTLKAEQNEWKAKIDTVRSRIGKKGLTENIKTKLNTLESKAKKNIDKINKDDLDIDDFTSKDNLIFQEIELVRVDSDITRKSADAERKLKLLETKRKELDEAIKAGKEESVINEIRKTVKRLEDAYNDSLKEVETLEKEKTEIKESVSKLKKITTVDSETTRFVTDQGHESVVRIDSTHSDGTEVKAGLSTAKDSDITIPEDCKK